MLRIHYTYRALCAASEIEVHSNKLLYFNMYLLDFRFVWELAEEYLVTEEAYLCGFRGTDKFSFNLLKISNNFFNLIYCKWFLSLASL
ncbi:protein of unknown function [Legionella longbeachae NSW150]|uniref:Uncharacterized protein n=1 Tax=Legionella longbeachae serogroup 1 (strain NSW150) TaxID=661367 RepID=D3HNL9_LEGLN|nr:protein of unknown function [Legionella longbeachae NSW150]